MLYYAILYYTILYYNITNYNRYARCPSGVSGLRLSQTLDFEVWNSQICREKERDRDIAIAIDIAMAR